MENQQNQITAIVVNALAEALEELELKDYEATPESEIYGGGSPLDSIALVSMVIDIESHIEEDFGATISLTDERAVSQKNSPFQDVPNMVAYILNTIREKEVA